MENELEFIKELGIGVEPAADNDTEVTALDNTNESENDLSLEQEGKTSQESKDESAGTEQNDLMDALKKQIEGMEKRITDKDDYINSLKEKSKADEVATEESDTEDDFWDNPEAKFKEMQETMRIQDMRIQETVFANTVEDYWKTVNPEKLQEAVATNNEFAQEFNSSREPYKTAYEYLTNKAKETSKSTTDLKEQIRQELMKEYGLEKKKVSKEVPPSITNTGSSNTDTTKSNASEDGFASVFGQ